MCSRRLGQGEIDFLRGNAWKVFKLATKKVFSLGSALALLNMMLVVACLIRNATIRSWDFDLACLISYFEAVRSRPELYKSPSLVFYLLLLLTMAIAKRVSLLRHC